MSSETNTQTAEVIHEILRAIQQLRFGSVEITVHEGRVTQIERREKVRFGSATGADSKQQNQEQFRSKPTAKAAAHT